MGRCTICWGTEVAPFRLGWPSTGPSRSHPECIISTCTRLSTGISRVQSKSCSTGISFFSLIPAGRNIGVRSGRCKRKILKFLHFRLQCVDRREQRGQDQRFRNVSSVERHQRGNVIYRHLRLDGTRSHPQGTLLRESRRLVSRSSSYLLIHFKTIWFNLNEVDLFQIAKMTKCTSRQLFGSVCVFGWFVIDLLLAGRTA